MIANLGFGALVITLLVSLFGIAAAFYGARKNAPSWVDSARNAMLLTFPLVSLATLCILYLLITGHYEVAYVAQVASNSMPIYLKITALWGGQAGSLVFWTWLLSAFASAVTLRKWDRDREFLPWVIVVALVTLAFFLVMILFFENPFDRIWQPVLGQPVVKMFQPAGAQLLVQADGNGLNPLLRHPGMIIHPPMLYLGFVSFTIPYAFAIAALITGRTDDRWIRITRRWTLVAWLFLSLGLILGMRWAYDVLGWGGFWGWDAVEVAALLPWLSGTPFLHSVMIQEKRGMLKQWNMVLIILTYDLVIFGTFLTRTGTLSSVHAFAQSAIGPIFFIFIGLTFITSLGLLLRRWGDLRSESEMTSMFSREALFLLNNLLFILILVVCFIGVIFPLVSELVTGQKITVDHVWYERNTGPLWAGLLLLMGVAPLSAWKYSTIKTLGVSAWKPFAVSLIGPAFALFTGTRQPAALLGYWLCSFVIVVTVYEFGRGALARHRQWGESILVALWRLAGRNRRRYGGYTIHLGIVMMALGVIGVVMFQTQTQGTISQGQQLALGGYSIRYDSLSNFIYEDGRNIKRASISVFKNGNLIGDLHPRQDYYYESQETMTIPGRRTTSGGDDLYVILVDWQPISPQQATFKIFYNPLVNWLWWGGIVLILGTLIAAWPDREPEAAVERVRSTRAMPAEA